MSPGLTESLAEDAHDELEASEIEPIDSPSDAPAMDRARVELRAQLRGVGLWTPAHPSLDAWVEAGMPDRWATPASPARPPAALLHSRLRRRTSTLTRAAVTAIEAAVATSGGDLGRARFVLVSSFGEIQTTVTLLSQLAEPGGPVSPTKFHNSVHNTATGYLSIATGNHSEATALAGGPHSLDIGLLEVLAGFAEGDEEALLVFAEERLPPPFTRDDAEQTFAVALHLASSSSSSSSARASASAGGVQAGGDSRAESAPGLGLELRLVNGPSPQTPTALAPGVGGVGLPSMVAPLFELLREVVAIERGAEPGRVHALGAGHDPAVASTWATSLHRLSRANRP